jgi:hypothetical protein
MIQYWFTLALISTMKNVKNVVQRIQQTVRLDQLFDHQAMYCLVCAAKNIK